MSGNPPFVIWRLAGEKGKDAPFENSSFEFTIYKRLCGMTFKVAEVIYRRPFALNRLPCGCQQRMRSFVNKSTRDSQFLQLIGCIFLSSRFGGTYHRNWLIMPVPLFEQSLRNKILFSNKFCQKRQLIYVQCVVRPLETVSLWRLHL